jgi:hypothetical protein
MNLNGNLTEVDVKTLISFIKNIKATGKLIINNNSSPLTVYFKNGEPVDAEGEKEPTETIEKIISLEQGFFEFKKNDNIPESKFSGELSELLSTIDSIKLKWKKIKSRFPTQNLTVTLSETKNNNEIKLSGEEWKILSFVKEPIYLYELIKISPFRELKTLSLVLSLQEKELIHTTKNKEDKLMPEDEVIPLKKAGRVAVNTVIYGEKNIEFYKKIDNKKDFVTIVKEIGINFKDGRDILKYLLSQGKISLRKKTK